MKKIIFLLLAVVTGFAYGQNITQAEYFYDLDPGFGQGQAITITAASNIEVDEMLNIDALNPGFHTLHIRVKDGNNEWSSVLSHSFFIDNNLGLTSDIIAIEYFFDADPGFGQAQSIPISAANDIEINEMFDIATLSSGFHIINIRVKNQLNEWSPVLSKPFYIDKNRGTASEIDYLEYYFDEDPGYNNGIPYNDFDNGTLVSELFFADMSGIEEGNHTIFLRMRNELQLWSQTLSQNFELVNCDLTLSGNIKDQAGGAITAGFVVLYQNFGEGSAMGVDTISLTDGSYQFTSACPNSHYFIKAFPENESQYMATYYGDSPYWQEASIISTNQGNLTDLDIQMFQFAEMDAGNSQVGGHIYHAAFKGQPVKNIDVVLEYDTEDEKVDFVAVAASRSDEVGAWNIPDLPNGKFRIKVEVPGLEMDTTYYVDITAGNTIIDNLDYYIDFNTGIFIDYFGIEEYNLAQSINLFPNPATNGNFWIESSNTQVMIENIIIYQYTGQQLGNHQIHNQNYKVDVSHLPKGFYIISIQTNKGIINQKVMIQ